MRQRGFTITEALVAIGIIAILAALAIPSFRDTIDKYRLKSAADGLYSALQFARSEAVKQNKTVSAFFISGASWCYGISASACDCSQAKTTSNCELGLVSGSDFTGIQLTGTTFSGDTTHFNALRGTADNGSVTFQSSTGKQARAIVSTLGRVRLCSPSGTLSSYPTC